MFSLSSVYIKLLINDQVNLKYINLSMGQTKRIMLIFILWLALHSQVTDKALFIVNSFPVFNDIYTSMI